MFIFLFQSLSVDTVLNYLFCLLFMYFKQSAAQYHCIAFVRESSAVLEEKR